MIDLQEIGTGAAGIFAKATMDAWEKVVLPHFPPCDDDMQAPAVEGYKKHFRATMLAWGDAGNPWDGRGESKIKSTHNR